MANGKRLERVLDEIHYTEKSGQLLQLPLCYCVERSPVETGKLEAEWKKIAEWTADKPSVKINPLLARMVAGKQTGRKVE